MVVPEIKTDALEGNDYGEAAPTFAEVPTPRIYFGRETLVEKEEIIPEHFGHKFLCRRKLQPPDRK